jgi:MOSC domain-containing protein YiiM
MTRAPAVASPKLVSVQVGRISRLRHQRRDVESAIRKETVEGACRVDELGLVGDQQADTVNHGGRDKAICCYSVEHFGYWTERLRCDFGPGSFGENFTVSVLTEEDVCVGDVLELGSTIVQVSQPRQPCFKLAALHRERQLALWVQESGLTGYYLRVLEPGVVGAGAEVSLVDRPHPTLTIAEANRVMHLDKRDFVAIDRLLVPELSASWQKALGSRLDGALPVSSAERLSGES